MNSSWKVCAFLGVLAVLASGCSNSVENNPPVTKTGNGPVLSRQQAQQQIDKIKAASYIPEAQKQQLISNVQAQEVSSAK